MGRLASAPGLVIVVVAGGLSVLATPGTSHADPVAAPERVELGVFGDSYASGAGTDKPSANYATRTVATSGRPASYVDPAHQSTRAPAWQAVDRIRRAHPEVDVHVAFDPVLGTTTGSFRTKVRTGTPFEHPAQLAETAGKDVVLLSIGGDEADLGGWARIAADAQEDTSASAFPGLLARLRDPAFARRLQRTYEAVLANMAPGGTLIVTTYPVILPDPVPAAALTGSAGWVITTREARLSNDYVRTLDAVIGAAVSAVAARAAQQHRHVDVVDLRDAFGQHLLFSAQPAVRGLLSLTDGGLVLDSFHPNDLGQQIIGQHLQPALDRAVTRAAAARGSAGRPAGPAGPGRPTPGGGGPATRPPLAQHGHGPAQPVSTSAGPPPSNPNHSAPAGSAPHGSSPPPGRSTPAVPNPVGRTPTSNVPSGSTPAGGVPTPGGSTPPNGSHPPAAPAPPAAAPAASGGSDADPGTATPAADPGAAESITDNGPTTESDPGTAPATDDATPTATDPADSPDAESNTDTTDDASDSPGSDSADGDSDGSDGGSDGDGDGGSAGDGGSGGGDGGGGGGGDGD